jgi:negative regulator of sigma E activity
LKLCTEPGFYTEAMKKQPSDADESLWRRKLSDAERVELRAQPELDLEARLTDALHRIPGATVPSNFTVRVLNAVELEESKAARQGWRWNWHFLLPRVAVATAVLLFAGISIQRYEAHAHRIELAKNVAMIAAKQPMPSLDALENLDVIRHMGASTHADGDLLAALQ